MGKKKTPTHSYAFARAQNLNFTLLTKIQLITLREKTNIKHTLRNIA